MSSAADEPDEFQDVPSSTPSFSWQDAGGRLLLPPSDSVGLQPNPRGSARASHACDRCRSKKFKCTGGARCARCIADNGVCLYSDGKRQRNRKDLSDSIQMIESLQQQNDELLSALQEICSRPNFQPNENPVIVQLLARHQNLADDHVFQTRRTPGGENTRPLTSPINQTSPLQSYQSVRTRGGSTPASESTPDSDTGLTTIVDLDLGAGAAGFIGKMSEISWVQRAQEYIFRHSTDRTNITQSEVDDHRIAANDLNYFIDDANLLLVNEDTINALDWPSPETALELSNAYFETLHTCFPFIDRRVFLNTLAQFRPGRMSASWNERRWLSMANLIFAIGSKHIGMNGNRGVTDHLVYYARARALGLDHRLLFDHPLFEQIQALGILGLYLFVNHSIGRAWTIIGHAIRHAVAMGLHLEVAGAAVNSQQKLLRAQAWYSLYNLEVALMEITGRPGCVALTAVTTPIDGLDQDIDSKGQRPDRQGEQRSQPPPLQPILPRPQQSAGVGQSSNPARTVPQSLPATAPSLRSKFLSYRIRLSIISHQISSSVYTGGHGMSWSDLQDTIRHFQVRLQQFLVDLPGGLSLGTRKIPPYAASLSRIELDLYYWSLQITLHRPCLVAPEIGPESEVTRPKSFNHQAAIACVEAALSMFTVLPRKPEAAKIYRTLPWWNLLHFICQAAAVLIIELCLGGVHCPSQVDDIVDCLKVALSYLQCMSAGSLSVFKAWRIFRQLLADATARLGIDVSDVPEHGPQPVGWTAEHERLLVSSLQNPARRKSAEPAAMST